MATRGRRRGAATLAARARNARFAQFVTRFADLEEMRVVDLGGAVDTWTDKEKRPAEVVLLNIPWVAREQQEAIEAQDLGGWMRAVPGDACEPPAELAGTRFDLVFSNSVIEHVGGHERRRGFANTVHTLAEHHWVQTPNRYFPLEPHWFFPGFQFLPSRVQAAAMTRWPIGNYTMLRDAPLTERMEAVLEIELLSLAQMRFYFPRSEIMRERVAGLTKSFIAVR